MPKGCERYTMEFCVEDENGEEVVYDVEFLISGADPGKLYGPPEDCWPPDPGDVEFFRVTEQKTGRELEGEEMKKFLATHDDYLTTEAYEYAEEDWMI